MITALDVKKFELNQTRYLETFNSMLPWLPRPCVDFLDIGCGLGGVAMQVSAHYGYKATAHLIDAEGPRDKWVGWHDDGEAYADVNVALALFAQHAPAAPVKAWPPNDRANIPPCDLIYSNVSWGHHYPIDTYLGLVRRCLTQAGILIVDLRKDDGHSGAMMLQRYFHQCAYINPGAPKKYLRTVWRWR